MPLLVTVATRVQRLLARRGIVDEGDGLDGWDPFADDAPMLAGLAAASVRGVAASAFDEAQATPSRVEGWGRSDCGSRLRARWCWTCAADGRPRRPSSRSRVGGTHGANLALARPAVAREALTTPGDAGNLLSGFCKKLCNISRLSSTLSGQSRFRLAAGVVSGDLGATCR